MLTINGGQNLNGTVIISGSKNSALAIIAAALLSVEPVRLTNMPLIEDIFDMRDIIVSLGGSAVFNAQGEAVINSQSINNYFAVHPFTHRIRASSYFLGALLGRFGRACVVMPGGCNIGARPINYHIDGLVKLGAKYEMADGKIFMSADGGLKGAVIDLPYPSVGATINIMMAAVLAEGVTEINNAATEPNVTDTVMFLRSLGAQIHGTGTSSLIIKGGKTLSPIVGSYAIPPDPIETGTYLIYCAICGGDVTLEGTRASDISAVIKVLRGMGAQISAPNDTSIRIKVNGRLKAAEIVTGPHPQFPTDLQQLIMSLMAVSDGVSTITETVFENRFRHSAELNAMGANITIDGNTAVIKGVEELVPASVTAYDLRGGAALVAAALKAKGITVIEGDGFINRGYQDIAGKLSGINAEVSVETQAVELNIS